MDYKRHCLATLLVFIATPALSSVLQLGIDNDVIFQSDGDYTNGLYIGYGKEMIIANPVGFMELDDASGQFSAQLGQKIWTPSEIGSKTPIANERPYAGLLYLKLGAGTFNTQRAWQASMLAGTMGPASGAESVQKNSHRWFSSTTPEGWGYQVKNQLVADVSLEFDQLLDRSNQHEFSGYGRVVAGNFQPEVAAGIGWRYGNGLNDTFNSSYLRPYRQSVMTGADSQTLYLYGNIEGRYRFKDKTLSGDTLKTVSEVTLKKAQTSATLGAVGYYGNLGISFAVTGYSHGFNEDKEQWHLISSLSFSWQF